MAEQRGETRVQAYWSVLVVRTDKTQVKAKTVNVSPSGMRIVSRTHLKQNEKLLVCVNAYFNGIKHNVTFVGKVAYVTFKRGDELTIGIQVVSRGEAYRDAVIEYMGE